MTRSESSWCGEAPFGPGADDDEVDRLVTLVEDGPGDVGTDLALGAARPEPLPHARVHAIDRETGLTQGVDLVGVLADAQLLDEVTAEDLARLGEGVTEREDARCPHVVVDADRPGITHQRGHQGVRVVQLAPRLEAYVDTGRDGGGLLERRYDEGGLTVGRQHEARQPLERQGHVAGQVAKVRPRRDEQGVDALRCGQLLCFAPSVHEKTIPAVATPSVRRAASNDA